MFAAIFYLNYTIIKSYIINIQKDSLVNRGIKYKPKVIEEKDHLKNLYFNFIDF